MDINILNKALENENNEKILNLTTEKMNKMKLEILKELELSKLQLKEYFQKLRYYRYIDEINELDNGAFIRWIPISDPENIYLTNGAIVCEIKITDQGIQIVCKNFAKKCYQLKMDESLIFQKLTNQELIILSALDHLTK
jgi:hypothetical protein